MMLLRLWLSEARFHYSQWLRWRGIRKARAGLALMRKADTIRRLERIYLELDAPEPGLGRPPSVPSCKGDE